MNFITKKDRKRFVNVARIFPNIFPTGNKVILNKLNDELIKVCLDLHGGKITRIKPIIIRRFIPICGGLFQLLGLWSGDGIKMKEGKHKTFGFANNQLNLHKLFLSLSKECLSIDSTQFKCGISVPSNMKVDKNEIKKKISKELNIPIENFQKVRTIDGINLVMIKIVINSRLLAFLVKLISENLRSILFQNKNFAVKMLQGLIATEGCIVVRRWGKLDEITIGAKEKVKRDFIRKLLLILRIQPSKDKGEGQEAVAIHGLSNFKIFKKWDLVSLHPLKHKKFERGIKGFKREHFRKGEGRFLILKSLSESPKNRQELTELLNRSTRCICEIDLILLTKLGFIKRNRVGNKIVSWSITKKGLEVLRLKNPLNLLKKKSLLIHSIKLQQDPFEIFNERQLAPN